MPSSRQYLNRSKGGLSALPSFNRLSRLRSGRDRSGATVIELAVGSLLMVAFTLLCTDISVLMLASGVNNEACRDAARAAGLAETQIGQTPQQSALSAAKLALQMHKRVDGYFIKELKVVENSFVYNDGTTANYSLNGKVDMADPTKQPMVFVVTEITVKLPANITWFDKDFFKGRNGALTFQSGYLYPIMNVVAKQGGPFDTGAGSQSFPALQPMPGMLCAPSPIVPYCGGSVPTGGSTGGSTGGPGGGGPGVGYPG